MAFLPRETTVPDLNTFLEAVLDFAVANGGYSRQPDGADNVKILLKGGIYYSFKIYSPVYRGYTLHLIDFRMTYAAPSNDSEFQSIIGTRTPARMACYNWNGPYTSFYIYEADGCIHACLELAPQVYTHMSFGKVNKSGTYDGGEYITGASFYYKASDSANANFFHIRNNSLFPGDHIEYTTSRWEPYFPGTYIRHGNNGAFSDFVRVGNTDVDGRRGRSVMRNGSCFSELIEYYGYNSFNGRSPILSVYFFVRDPVSGYYMIVGTVPGVGYINPTAILEGAIVDNDWQVFPLIAKNSSNWLYYPANRYHGVAYKRV